MKSIKSLVLFGVFLFASSALINAQEAKSPWSFGVKAGINIFDHSGTVWGLNIGGTAEYALPKRFFLRSGLEFTGKGIQNSGPSYSHAVETPDGKFDQVHTSFSAEKLSTYLQVPLTLGYRLPISKDVNLTFNAGVYAGVSVVSSGDYGKYITTYHPDGTFDTESTGRSLDSPGKLDKAGTLDVGLMGGVGVEYKKFSINANYEHGLLEQGSKSFVNSGGGSLKTSNIALSLGYKF